MGKFLLGICWAPVWTSFNTKLPLLNASPRSGLAARGHAPIQLSQLNARHVPIRAVLFGTIVTSVVVARAALSPSLIFAFLVNATGIVILMAYILVCVAYLRLRQIELARTNISRRRANGCIGHTWRFLVGEEETRLGHAVDLAASWD